MPQATNATVETTTTLDLREKGSERAVTAVLGVEDLPADLPWQIDDPEPDESAASADFDACLKEVLDPLGSGSLATSESADFTAGVLESEIATSLDQQVWVHPNSGSASKAFEGFDISRLSECWDSAMSSIAKEAAAANGLGGEGIRYEPGPPFLNEPEDGYYPNVFGDESKIWTLGGTLYRPSSPVNILVEVGLILQGDMVSITWLLSPPTSTEVMQEALNTVAVKMGDPTPVEAVPPPIGGD